MNRGISGSALYELRCLNLKWETIWPREIDGNEAVQWCHIAEFEVGEQNHRLSLGLSYDGWWALRSADTLSEFRQGTRLLFLFPLLELDYDTAIRAIERACLDKGIPSQFSNSFPAQEMVIQALESGSQLWVRLALNWASKVPRSSELLDALQVAVRSAPEQKLRHSAMKLLAEMRRSTGLPPLRPER